MDARVIANTMIAIAILFGLYNLLGAFGLLSSVDNKAVETWATVGSAVGSFLAAGVALYISNRSIDEGRRTTGRQMKHQASGKLLRALSRVYFTGYELLENVNETHRFLETIVDMYRAREKFEMESEAVLPYFVLPLGPQRKALFALIKDMHAAADADPDSVAKSILQTGKAPLEAQRAAFAKRLEEFNNHTHKIIMAELTMTQNKINTEACSAEAPRGLDGEPRANASLPAAAADELPPA